jgi:hypothetical protein
MIWKIRDNIRRHGWHAQGIYATETTPSFLYTIGLRDSFNHPELLMIGPPVETCHSLVSAVVERIRGGGSYGDGDRIGGVAGGYEVALRSVPITAYDELFGIAAEFYGDTEFIVLQVVFPDASGRFPWEDGCDSLIGHLQNGTAFGLSLGG